MATFVPDTVEAADGSGGPTFIFDLVGTEYLSATKMVFGPDGSIDASWSSGAGAVDSGTGRVTLASDDPAVALLTQIESYQDTEIAAILTAVEAIDDWDAAFPTHGTAAGSIVAQIGVEGRSTAPTKVDDGDACRMLGTLLGKPVNYPYALPGSSWTYAAVSGGVTDTADDEAKAAAGSGSRNYVTRAQIINGSGTVSTEVLIKSGSTVLWRGWAQSIGGGVNPVFDPPLRGGDNEAINVANVTTSSKVYYNLQGFVSTE